MLYVIILCFENETLSRELQFLNFKIEINPINKKTRQNMAK